MSAHAKWTDGRKAAEGKKKTVREEAKEVLAPVKVGVEREKDLAREVMEPVYTAISEAKTRSKKTRPYVTSFMISSVVSWVAGPQILIALYERIWYRTSTADWGILHGPGRWFRDTLAMATETNRLPELISAIVVGLLPMVIMCVRDMVTRHIASGSYLGRLSMVSVRSLTRLAYAIPVVFFLGVSYKDGLYGLFGIHWQVEWWQIWVMGLFCSAYYCTTWALERAEKGLGLGYFHVLLMTPAAAIITGAALHAPGAAW
ncbi:hypothetical protein [Streptomyces cucumeris]|uniref:hypothetical protein n=1 Tax=Streptomyces cucumeris TaxID=2962890 RepID=UPI0020C8AD77|nr:hypothetical protein [Streptomyces sp. NEAU-Y11]